VADQHDCETRPNPGGFQALNLRGNFGANVIRDFCTVKNPGSHQCSGPRSLALARKSYTARRVEWVGVTRGTERPSHNHLRTTSWRTIAGMIAQDLLEILVCPACKQALQYRENPESLKCTQCHRIYAVKDDIPIMLVDDATIESA
jgi:hypothetical protein